MAKHLLIGNPALALAYVAAALCHLVAAHNTASRIEAAGRACHDRTFPG